MIKNNLQDRIIDFEMRGLNCASCADKILDTLKSKGYKNSEYNFATSVMTIRSSDEIKELKDKLQKITNSFESGVKVILRASDFESEKESRLDFFKANKFRLLRVFSGALGLITLNLIENFYSLSDANLFMISVFFYLLTAYMVIYRGVLNILKLKALDENFLMMIATLGAFAINEHTEALAVMVFYELGEFLQSLAVGKSQRAIKAALNKKIKEITVERGAKELKIKAKEVMVGDIILLKTGDMLACDGKLLSDDAEFDPSAINGEFNPVLVKTNENITSGYIATNKPARILVEKPFEDSKINEIMKLTLEAGKNKAKIEKLVSKFAKYYTPFVIALSILTATLIPFLTDGDYQKWLYNALVFLVISCPCAIVLSVPLTYFATLGRASSEGILLKGANYLEELNSVNLVAFDKTGTLTKAKFSIKDVKFKPPYTRDDILLFAKIAEKHSNHPIAKALSEYTPEIEKSFFTSDYSEIAGKGVSVKLNSKLLKLGREDFVSKDNENFIFDEKEIYTKVFLSLDDEMIGVIYLGDTIKKSSKSMISSLKKEKIKTAMFTGDKQKSAEYFANELGIDDFKAELLPENKLSEISKLKKKYKKIAFVGDGINDAPVLQGADVGISMGVKGSDIAIESSDIVILNDDIGKIIPLFSLSKMSRKIIIQNIVFALSVKTLFMALGFASISSMWMAIFADVGVSLITIVNSLRMLKYNKTK